MSASGWELALAAVERLDAGRPKEALKLLARLPRPLAGWALLLRSRAKQALGQERLSIADVTRAFELDLECGWIFDLPVERLTIPSGEGPRRLHELCRRFSGETGCFAVRAFVGKLRAQYGRASEGLPELDRAVQDRPKLAYPRAWRAEIRRRLGDFDGALADADGALAIDRSNGVAWASRAAVLRAQGRAAEAFACADEGRRRDPRYEPCFLEAARAALALKDGRLTLERLEEAARRSCRYGWRSLYEGGPPPLADLDAFAADPALAPPRWAARLAAWRGEALLGLGRAAEAEESLRRALSLDPGFAWARAWLGEALAALEKRARALRELERAARLSPRYARAWLSLGRERLSGGEARAALRAFDRALRAEPRWALAHYWRARAWAFLKENGVARTEVDAALLLDPRFADAQALRRELSSGEGDWDAAARALSKGRYRLDLSMLLRNDPRNDLMYSEPPRGASPPPAERRRWRHLAKKEGEPELWALCAAAELAAGNPARALPLLARALRARPGWSPALLLRAAARLVYGSFVRRRRTSRWHLGAIADLDRVLAERPDDARARRLRGEARKDLQDYEGAREDLERALAVEPENEWARAELAELLCDLGRFDDAWAFLKPLEERHARAGWYWALCGRALATTGRAEEGLACMQKAARLSPKSAPVLAWRGEAFRKVGRLEEALADFNESVRLDPRFSYAYEWRGRLLLSLGRAREALSDLEKVLKLDPRHYLGPALRGAAYLKLGRPRQAAADFDSVHPLDPRTIWPARPGMDREEAFWAELDACVRARPSDPWALALRGRSLAVAGRFAEGERDLRESLRIADGSYARGWLGYALLGAGDAAGALVALRGAGGRWAAAWRGRALWALGRHRAALDEFDRALAKRDSLVASVSVWKAEALRALGRGEEAARELERSGRWRGLASGRGRRVAAP